MGGYGKATALARERTGAGGWIAYAASGGREHDLQARWQLHGGRVEQERP